MKKEANIERLTEWINEQGQWWEDYQNNEDCINGYAELFEGENLFLGEIDSEIRDEVETILNKMKPSEIYDYCSVELTEGIGTVENEIWSINKGEVECQFSMLSDEKLKTNCVYTLLCTGLTDEEIEEARDNCDYCISGDCIYIDCSYDRVSLILDTDRLLKEKKKLLK